MTAQIKLKTAAGGSVTLAPPSTATDLTLTLPAVSTALVGENSFSGSAGASKVGYLPAGTGAVATDVQSKLREYVSVKDFGAVGDGVADDTLAVQNAVNAAIAAGVSLFVPKSTSGLGLYKVTAPISISTGLRIYGASTNYSGLLCVGCDGFVIAAGVNFVTLENLAIVQAVRYSTAANNHVAVRFNGTTGSRNFWSSLDNMFIDGFKWAVSASYVWSTSFTNIVSVYGFGGITAPGLSVNNFVSMCSFGGSSVAESVGILLGDGTTPTEGWMISDCLIAHVAVGVHGNGANNCHLRGCIIDFVQQRGVFLQSTAYAASTNWVISDNYIACDSPDGATGIWLLNDHAASSAQHRGTVVSGNQILAYAGASLAYGILQSGSADERNVITNNRIAATVYACFMGSGTNSVVDGNYWKSGAFHSNVRVLYGSNTGTVSSSPTLLTATNGSKKFGYGTAAPVVGAAELGDIVWHFEPVAGGNVGWVCTAGGTPGTWKTFGAISA